jgi:dTDP-4-dehydrorhamnose 3,5-epimerase
VLRGLHYQRPAAHGKLVWVLHDWVFDVAVDIRVGSPRIGDWVGVTLSSRDNRQIYVPTGPAHGFMVTNDTALVLYQCTDFYTSGDEGSVHCDDPSVGIAWPFADPMLARKYGIRSRSEHVAEKHH